MTEFYGKSAGGGGKEEPVLSQTVARASGVLSTNIMLWDWSPDGRYLLFSTPRLEPPTCGRCRSRGMRSRYVFCLRRAISFTVRVPKILTTSFPEILATSR